MRRLECRFLAAVPVRAWFATLALGTWGLVAVGLELQALLRLAPCPLCIFQRILYLAIGFLGWWAFPPDGPPRLVRPGCLAWTGGGSGGLPELDAGISPT